MTPKEKPRTIKFDRKAIKAYCDRLIMRWREKRDRAIRMRKEEDIFIAKCYVDAFQSVRISLFGYRLVKKKKDKHE